VNANDSTVGVVAKRSDLPPLSPTLERLRAHVLEHSVKHGTFTLKSGATSSWFLDTKQTACRADGIVAVADALIEVFGDDFASIDAIGGLTMGADPVAFGVAAVAATRGHQLRSFSVRKEAKQGGITGRIAGALNQGDRVLVTEDTTTRGTSLIEAAEQIAEFGAVPAWMTVVVDRGGTCAAMAAEAGIDYRPLLTAPDLGFDYGT
jgi:orotate phosphoribosyltransferase